MTLATPKTVIRVDRRHTDRMADIVVEHSVEHGGVFLSQGDDLIFIPHRTMSRVVRAIARPATVKKGGR